MQRIAILLASILSFFPMPVLADLGFLNNYTRVGVELGQRTLKWQENKGKNHFAESFPQLGIFVEVPLLHQISVKLGREGSVGKNNLAMYSATDTLLSTPLGALGRAQNFATSAKITTNYIDIAYNLDFFRIFNSATQFTYFVGVAKTKLSISHENVTDANINARLMQDLTPAKKTYIRQGIALQAIFDNGLGGKIGINHERTSKLKSRIVDVNNDIFSIEARDSLVFNFAILYQF